MQGKLLSYGKLLRKAYALLKKTTMHFDLHSLYGQQPDVSIFENLEIPFTEEKVNAVVNELPLDKSPGPDGFNNEFFKSCWDIIKGDVLKLIVDFHAGQLSMESINTSYITLIPKSGTPLTVNDFRPISLLNCCLKLITKLLANRLQKVILKLVHINQYGFLKERAIHDYLGWAYEYLHQCHKSKEETIVLKLGFEKAFDTIEHQAMLDILKAKGLGDRWITWIRMFFSFASSAIMLNGVPREIITV